MINTKIKQAHTSSNMFDWRADGAIYNSVYTESSGWITHYYMYMTPLIAVKGGETYTWRISADTSSTSSRLTDITTVYYDKDLNEIGCASHDDSVRYYSFTVPQNCAYVRCPTSEVEAVDRESMLNVGSSPLPYEEHYAPYYDTVSYAKSITGAQTYTKFPIVLRTTEQSIPTWSVKGNMQQSGTPTPTSPITPQECGERTANLFDKNTMTANAYLSQSNGQYLSSTGQSYSCIIKIKPNTSYRVRTASQTMRIAFFTQYPQLNDIPTAYYNHDAMGSYVPRAFIETSGNTNTYMVVFCYNNAWEYVDGKTVDEIMSTVMISEGTEMTVPYEPYGYKFPVISGNTTTNIYLSEPLRKIGDYADTIAADGTVTRRIKKIVFDGTEQGWGKNTGLTNSNAYAISLSNWVGNRKIGYCTHYENVTSAEATEGAYFGNSLNIFTAISDGLDNATKFKNWLAEQYANGAPVTVWYVLATPTTETTTTSAIPTTSGLNTIDVATTLKPSEMSLTYDGYKLCKRQRYTLLMHDNPLCGISTYKDTLNLATGVCTRQIKKVVLNGTETWSLQSINTYGIANFYTSYEFLTGISDRSAVNSHFYQTTAPIAEITEPCFSISPTSEALYLKVRSSVASTVEDIKAWLAAQYANGTPVTVWYILATPTTETITVPTGLSGTEEGYLTQSETPTPTNPVYPTANDVPVWE